MSNYNPLDHYWAQADGRVFSSARQAVVDPSDADYVAWKGGGRDATPWPRDDNGAQSLDALQAVLAPWGIIVDPAKRLLAYAAKKHKSVIDSGVVYNMAPEGQPAVNVSVDTHADGRSFLSGAVELATLDPAHVFTWVQDSGDVQLSGDQVRQIGLAVGHFVQAAFATYGQVLAGIRSGSITTTDQVDQAAWPTH